MNASEKSPSPTPTQHSKNSDSELNDVAAACPTVNSIHEQFRFQARRYPNKVAVSLPTSSRQQSNTLTYRELDRRSDYLAVDLRKRGLKPGDFVAVCIERSLELVVAVLGILKAGGAYFPLDPAYPEDRLAFMLADAAAPIILTQESLRSKLPTTAATILHLEPGWGADAPQDLPIAPISTSLDTLAYVNYTSGSTGQPKGVAVPHRGVLRLVLGADYTPLDHDCVILQLAPISFDAATLELWGPLLNGGHCVLFPGDGLPDPRDLEWVLREYGVTTLWLTASLFNTLIMDAPEVLAPVQHLLTGGEALSVPHIRRAQALLPETQLINGYGPTESTTFTCCYRIPRPLPADCTNIPIGYPINRTQVYILDDQQQPVPPGQAGELYIGGDGLAQGYLNLPEKTADRFVPNPFTTDPQARLYRTGDMVQQRPDEAIEFLGRQDNQVKLRGFRIELGEIEAALMANETVQTVLVLLREDTPGRKRLVAYVTGVTPNALDPAALKAGLRDRLAAYMVPEAIVVLDQIPLTLNGKADCRALPVPPETLVSEPVPTTAPQTELEAALTAIWAAVLEVPTVSIRDNFFDMGGTSLLGMQVALRIQQQISADFRVVKLYEHPTIAALAQYLTVGAATSLPPIAAAPIAAAPNAAAEGIAIVGMAGRFPGADSVDRFWQNLCDGVESHTVFSLDQLDPSIPAELRNDPSYVPVRGIVNQADQFDAAFFGISPREAEVMDPQARVFLEVVYEALENAGCSPDNPETTIGLYAGSGHNTYFARHLCGRPGVINRLGEFQVMLANEKDFVTTRAAYKLNLQGPVVSVNTACSTSLVAVIQAFQALRDRQCDIALAGGISIITPQASGHLYQEGSMLSGDGHCRPFDAAAQGTLFNDGAAVVALKRLSDAQRDGDLIYAVIHGTGMNNDGADKVSFTAPSVIGQARAIATAQAEADFTPDTIGYVETHGTATPLGDPIEIEALTQAFRRQTDAKQFCAIGSVKSNVGHLVAAAGVTGLLKTALALYHRRLPASLHFQAPNPHIDFANSPFYVQAQASDWPQSEQPRRAGVSSFGVGGTNAHVVLEEAPAPAASSLGRPYQLLLLSAKTSTALEQATQNLQTYLAQHPELNIADVAYTLQRGRLAHHYRQWWVCDRNGGLSALQQPDPNFNGRSTERQNPEVVFMYPGQGSQYLQMGANLYADEPVFREALDTCAAILLPILGQDIRSVIYPAQNSGTATQQLQQTRWTQPALFAVEYALTRLWQSWGVQPSALTGHSIGEFVAACIAGVFSLEMALELVARRGQLMYDLPAGSMLSVRAAADEIQPYLSEQLAIAAVNAPGLCVISGPTEAITTCQQRLDTAEIPCRLLHTSHAFHSPMMAAVREPLRALLESLTLSPPQIPIVSTVTGDWLTDAEATNPAYWVDHALATVKFAEGIATLWQQPDRILLEVGPRITAATLARRQIQDAQQQLAISSLGKTAESHQEWQALWSAVGRLWAAGVAIDWAQIYTHERRHRVPLPSYPFERQRYWIDPPRANPAASPASVVDAVSTHDSATNFAPLPVCPSIHPPTMTSRKPQLIEAIKAVLEESSGLELADADSAVTFLELGLDSLSLTQVGIALKKKVGVKVTFRQLLEDFPTLDTLATHLDEVLPVEAFTPPAAAEPAAPAATLAPPSPATVMTAQSNGHNGNGHHSNSLPITAAPPSDAVQTLVAQQLQIMQQQLALLGQGTTAPSTLPTSLPAAPATSGSTPLANGNAAASEASKPRPSASSTAPTAVPKKIHGPGARIEKSKSTDLSAEQQAALDRFIARYTTRTKTSKQQAQSHRRHLADPRTVSGFSPLLKEVVYPIVTDRSAGSKLWDVDGNEYVDLTNGFGLNFFGWSPDFIKQAVTAQMDQGIEIGPQTPLAGRVAQMVSEFTGMERVAFCNTGSEAVMAALRLSRTVTGRNRVAIFKGGYHGTFDEVIVRGGPKHRSFPAAPGIMSSAVENVLMLDYGTPESLEVLRSQADDLAAILVEPVQSRRPDLQPKEFLQDLRHLTEQSDTAFIFDEVVTGFRVHSGGAQAYFNIQADLATYGKVIGGGLPIGVVAGKAEYMDALDGGFWQFGDDSIPEVGVTFFAGTFVRHPMALAAAEAVLTKLKELGPEAQRSLADKVSRFANQLNDHFQRVQAPVKIAHFTSIFYVKYDESEPYGGLLFYLLREKGVHVWEHRPCFFTLAHTDTDIEFVIRAFKNSVAELQIAGFLSGVTPATAQAVAGNGTVNRNRPPQSGARLGKDPQGNPAWYIPDPERPGKYLQVGAVS